MFIAASTYRSQPMALSFSMDNSSLMDDGNPMINRRRSSWCGEERHHFASKNQCAVTHPSREGSNKGRNPLAASELAAMEAAIFRSASACPQPVVIFLGGGSGSGKSTVLTEQRLRTMLDAAYGYAYINTGDAKRRAKAARIDVDGGGDSAAVASSPNSKVSGRSRISSFTTDQIFCAAVLKRLNIVCDHRMSHFDESIQRLSVASAHGYRCILLGATVAISVAAERARERTLTTGKTFNLTKLVHSHRQFSAHFLDYARLIPDHQLYDNNGAGPGAEILIYDKGQVVDERRFAAFLAKATTTEEAVLKQLSPALFDGSWLP